MLGALAKVLAGGVVIGVVSRLHRLIRFARHPPLVTRPDVRRSGLWTAGLHLSLNKNTRIGGNTLPSPMPSSTGTPRSSCGKANRRSQMGENEPRRRTSELAHRCVLKIDPAWRGCRPIPQSGTRI